MRFIKLYLLLLLSVPIYSQAQEHARILSQQTVYEIIDANSVVQTETYRIRINSEEGYHFAYFTDYIDRFRKLEDVSMEVFTLEGKHVKKLHKNQGRDMSFSTAHEISDARMFILNPNYKNFPFILEVTSKVKLKGFIALQPWTPRPSFNLAVDKATFKVIYPRDVKIDFKEKHITGTASVEAGKNVRSFVVSALASVNRTVRFKDFYEIQPMVYAKPLRFELDGFAGSNASWISFGDWYHDLNQSPFQLEDSTVAFINGLDKSNKRSTIELLYKYMQDRTRYVSIQLGIGGFRSLPTEDVEKYGYGDCKALTTYMKNLLGAAGIKSHYILVNAGAEQPDIQYDFPGSQFNHVFLGIPLPSDTLYLECTSQITPANYIGKFTDDRHVLWIDKGKSSIIRSKVYDLKANAKKYSVEINVQKDGNAAAKFKTISGGVFFDDFQLYKLAPDDYIKKANLRKFSYPDFSIQRFDYSQENPSLPVLSETFDLDIRGLAKVVGDKMVLPLMPAVPAKQFIDKDELLKYYSVRRAFTIDDEIILLLPDNFWVYSLPQPEKIISDFGSYEFNIRADEGDKIRITRKFTIKKGEYTEDKKYEEFKKFFDAIEKFENKKLVLNSKT